ncbi:group II truncated hemoglobin [Zhongshania sp.]|uniref:group II truncated hemoglobin n=1 Tax=Zhongshania sp. TaxID=1971902 RepID=UPI001B3CFBA4|nr:group II truncated hemoglobin [Zhongshania sp.]MBQ0796134.1 group II truncated hemoglobin [Zhongshania sp.]
MSQEQTPYQILGEEKIKELANTFYDVMDELPDAKHIRNMHSKSLVDIKQKLAEYLTGWLGGPPVYQQKHGTVCLTKPHAPFAIGPEERNQWLLCFNEALERIGASEELKGMLRKPVFRLADAVRNRDESLRESSDLNIIAASSAS